MSNRFLPLFLITLPVAGCMGSDPGPQVPQIALAESFYNAPAGGAAERVDRSWWQGFNDTRLDALIARGLERNLDLKTALDRIRSAEAATRARGWAALVSGSGTARSTRSGGENLNTSTTDSTGFGAQYVLDFFGREDRRQDQAERQVAAAEFEAGTVRLAFLSSLISNYLELRYAQEALELTRQTLESRKKTLDLVQAKSEAGAADSLELERAKASYMSAKSAMPGLEESFHARLFAIATLLDTNAGELAADLSRGAPQPWPGHAVKTGTPADLLRNRPDIRAAEQDLVIAAKSIGIAEVALLPSLELDGSVSFSDATTWSFGPRLSVPILNRGALRADLEQAKIAAEMAETAWRKSVRAAVEEVQAAQGSWRRAQRDVAAEREIVATQERILELSRSSYEAGAMDLLDLLDAERSVTNARMSLANSVRDAAKAWAELQVAAGYGWQG